MPQVKGEFDVKRTPQPPCEIGDGVEIGHFRFDKRFHGPFQATSVVHMLAAMSPVEGSGAYVAIERLSGSLEGRRGTFFMQHNGTMARGQPSLSLTVVPDTGTDGLLGLAGSLAIDIVEGKHFYTFDYTLPDPG